MASQTPKHARCLVIIAVLILGGCGTGEPTAGFDKRPLVERSRSDASVLSIQESWWRNAVEASPATQWVINGKRQRQGTILVRGKLLAVEPGFALDSAGPDSRRIAFNAVGAEVDVVILRIAVSDGVTEEGAPPKEVAVALPLPAPTDLPSLVAELSTYEEFAAIIFPALALGDSDGLFEILDGRFFGPINRDDTVTFGSLLEGMISGVKAENVSFVEVKDGAGVIDLEDENGTRRAG